MQKIKLFEDILELQDASLTHIKRLNRVTRDIGEVLNAFTYSIPFLLQHNDDKPLDPKDVYFGLTGELKETLLTIIDDLQQFNEIMNRAVEHEERE